MQTRALQTLLRIYQVQSFTRAAKLQNMTLSALSQQMRTLEEELGATLFDRAFRPPRLTPLGRQVAEQAAQVLDAETRLKALSGASGRLTGQFRFGFIQSASLRVMPGFLTALRSRAPGVEVELATGLSESLSAQVAAGQLDGAVVTRVPDMGEGLIAQVIATEPMAAAVPIRHADLSPDQIAASLTFLHFRQTTGIGKLIAASLRNTGTRPARVLQLDGIEACVECVKEGLGYTILPLADLRRYSDSRVMIRTDMHPSLSRDLALVTRDDPVSETWQPLIAEILSDVALSD